MRLPTDLQILNVIYERYYDTFSTFAEKGSSRSSKIFVPIDIEEIAKDIGVDVDIVFGRLYYHLDEKYGYKRKDAPRVCLFTPVAGDDLNCVNFPYAASILADLRQENRKYRIATSIAVFSLIISVIATLIAVFL